ncbi:hypothetical protein [Streptomyces albus]|uniref:hypothetical protein n=1 Tax=Streptomyces sp. NRRL F-5917 TaxID=1463873 RepID=UPI0004C1FC00|nr:hypothetical protein [Streptomyces sp. NRRL F-5917]
MNAVTDEEFQQAGEVTPDSVMRYLRGSGWSVSRDLGSGQLWELSADEGRPYQVLVPVRPQVRDYAARISDLLETLSAVEARRPGDVLREMFLPSADWQFLRLTPPGPSGTAPLVDVVPALAGLRDLMTAAAASSVAPVPQPVQPAQKPQQVKEYVARVRLDQTRVGSYVVAAHTPLSTPVHAGEPFERSVTRRLYASVLCAREAAAASVAADELQDFLGYTGVGLSANLCEALVKISGEKRDGFSLAFAWSPDIPVGQKTAPIPLARPHLEVLEAAARDLRARAGRTDVALQGTVVRLRRELPYGPGEITVSALTEEWQRPRRVRVHLAEPEYERAAEAHRLGHEVVIQGDVRVSGTAVRMESVTSFMTVPVDD